MCVICLCFLLPLVFPSCPVVPWGAGPTHFQLLSYLRVISVDSPPSPGDESPAHPFIHSPASVLAAAAVGNLSHTAPELLTFLMVHIVHLCDTDSPGTTIWGGGVCKAFAPIGQHKQAKQVLENPPALRDCTVWSSRVPWVEFTHNSLTSPLSACLHLWSHLWSPICGLPRLPASTVPGTGSGDSHPLGAGAHGSLLGRLEADQRGP